MAIFIGCGSWTDPEYTGVLYPSGVKPAERLPTYAKQFGHVEVNATYYRPPAASMTALWVRQTPPSFRFEIKLHRAVAQSPGSAAQSPLVTQTLDGVGPLVAAGRLACFLLVLPPTFAPPRHALAELDDLIEKLRPHRLAVELRHRGWVTAAALSRTLGYFRERKLIWVAVDMPPLEAPSLLPAIDEVTNPESGYLRLHGHNPRYLVAKSAAERHDYLYTAADLAEVERRVRRLAANAADVIVVANNHAHDYAPRTALALRDRLANPP